MTQIMKASHRFAREGDESHANLKDMFSVLTTRDNESSELNLTVDQLRFEALGEDIFVHINGQKLIMTPWAFDQVCRILGAPKNYVGSKTNIDLAVECLNDDVVQASEVFGSKTFTALQQIGENSLLRALTSTRYSRIWDSQITHQFIEHTDNDVVPAGYLAGGGTSNPEKTGLYTSDRDAFWFMANENDPIDINGEQLSRGIIVWNSEVGHSAIGYTSFLYRYICGNHIVWGAQNVVTRKRRHVGKVNPVFQDLPQIIETLCTKNDDNTEFERVIKAAQEAAFWSTEEDGVEKLRKRGMPAKDAKSAIANAVLDANLTNGDPKSLWGTVQGITRYSQGVKFQERRLALDTMAGELLTLV